MPTWSKPVYRARRSVKSAAQRDALLSAYSNYVSLATHFRSIVGVPLAREYAKDSRNLIAAFGERWDKKPMRNRLERAS